MIISEVKSINKEEFNRLALHPLQSWEWGEFRKKTGTEVIRLGRYDKNKLIETVQITIHPLPFTNYTIGYLPKGGIPSSEMLQKLVEVGKQYKCIFIKLEPNVQKNSNSQFTIHNSQLISSLHPLFTKYTFQLGLALSEEEILKNMHYKTRYNIRLAQKNKVTVKEDNTKEAFNKYLELTFETTKRQKFYAHSKRYHELMWGTLNQPRLNRDSSGQALTAHLLKATYQEETLVTWIVFLFNNVLYYPYGASSDKFRNVMASNLMMWEAIRFGKKNGAKIFDMWGALGPNLDKNDPWYGFHRFKEGYGGKHVEFIGSYDLIINLPLYRLYNTTYFLRQLFLKARSYLPF
ncbi:hypothetical protein A2960_04710 [Candidatus Gottesmanbacteria bacterium RIFCSPLOWO2_01_FULL_39_12b]|uniref:BioF2-like acetyltransferase domain-containing protein n=1 Tax=Candidatus Gottesmanbacteria bacterium RIFCSPLOWO2_01_FULL_39_12b TaxID=1798388 RepID=A0A1F6ANG0_9BACT|nr:MAG: hypothetical protein A2960_04710 [Candidatus Gottesmanbacteria bacterium RIFCSPLOWO2_01_FULL_39_12b]